MLEIEDQIMSDSVLHGRVLEELACWQQRAEAAEAKLAEAQKDTEQMVQALRNFMACHEMTLPTPYGHDCQWCGNRAMRSVVEARAAIDAARGKA